jgi:hypothetical protein
LSQETFSDLPCMAMRPPLARAATTVAVHRMMDKEVEERTGAAYWSHIGVIEVFAEVGCHSWDISTHVGLVRLAVHRRDIRRLPTAWRRGSDGHVGPRPRRSRR